MMLFENKLNGLPQDYVKMPFKNSLAICDFCSENTSKQRYIQNIISFFLLISGFVCVEVLRPSQPCQVMSSAVNLPNHMLTGQALSSKQLTSIVHIFCQKLTTAILESGEGKE